MDLRAEARLPCPPSVAYGELRILDAYPEWLRIVAAASPDSSAIGAWIVDLGTRLGPINTTKRVRMVRTRDESSALRFERVELDGASHSDWVLDVTISPVSDVDAGSLAAFRLYYSGTFPPLVRRVLETEMGRAGGRLAKRVRAIS